MKTRKNNNSHDSLQRNSRTKTINKIEPEIKEEYISLFLNTITHSVIQSLNN